MKFKNLINKDICDIIEYLNKVTNKPLYIDNTMVSTIELSSNFKYRVNKHKELNFNDTKEGKLAIPLDDKEIELFSEKDMLVLVQTYSEFPGVNSFNVVIFNIEEDKLTDIMKIIQLEKE